jgi:hypothetical protein
MLLLVADDLMYGRSRPIRNPRDCDWDVYGGSDLLRDISLSCSHCSLVSDTRTYGVPEWTSGSVETEVSTAAVVSAFRPTVFHVR